MSVVFIRTAACACLGEGWRERPREDRHHAKRRQRNVLDGRRVATRSNEAFGKRSQGNVLGPGDLVHLVRCFASHRTRDEYTSPE
jgi:hypothetical protein